MVHILNNIPEEYDVILDGLENHLMSSGPDVFMLEVIFEKLKHQYGKIQNLK